MKLAVQVRLLPTPAQASALTNTLHSCNAAATWLSEQIHTRRVFGRFQVQKHWYVELRNRFGLSAQPAIRVISKVVGAYSALRANIQAGNYGAAGSRRRQKVETTPIRFAADAAQPYDVRCLSWQIPETGRGGTVSIWTAYGRLKNLQFMGNPAHLTVLRNRKIGETDLIYRGGQWLLHAAIDTPEAPPKEPVNGFLGVDLGIVNIATTSDGNRSCGSRLIRYRKRQQRIQNRLQAKKTASARRLLRKRRRKEARARALA